AGARKAALLLALVPLFLLMAPVYIALWGWTTGGLHVLFGALMAWLMLEAQLVRLEKLPFTCSFVPGKANLKTCWTFYVLGYLAYVGALSWLDLTLLEAPYLFPWFVVAVALARRGIEAYRNRNQEFGISLVYDERPESTV